MTALDPSASQADRIAGPSGVLARLRRRSRPRVKPRSAKDLGRSFTITFIAVVVVAAFLSPLLRSFTMSIKSPEQIAQVNDPLLPSSPATFEYNGHEVWSVWQSAQAPSKSLWVLAEAKRTSRVGLGSLCARP